MTKVVLGNRHTASHAKGLGVDPEEHRGKRATIIEPDDSRTIGQVFREITDPAGAWAYHSTEGSKPAWVASDSESLAALLAEHYGCEVRALEDPLAHLDSAEQPKGKGGGGRSTFLPYVPPSASLLLLALAFFARLSPMLKTNGGQDFQAAQMAGAASATAVSKWVALTANTTAPAATDTTLTGEIVTAGLTRQVGTYAHTTGVNTYTITTTFTAQAADVPVTVGKRAHFTAITGGTMTFEVLVTPTATLSAAGDTLTLTDTVTM